MSLLHFPMEPVTLWAAVFTVLGLRLLQLQFSKQNALSMVPVRVTRLPLERQPLK